MNDSPAPSLAEPEPVPTPEPAPVVAPPVRPSQKSGNTAKLRLATVAVILIGLALGMRLLLDGDVKIETDPPGASVFINGHLSGRTPLSLRGLSRGTYSVRFEREHCGVVNAPLNVGWGGTKLSLKLPAGGDGGLKINVGPPGAEVLLDGELIGHTPYESSGVEPGVHELLIRKTNFKPYSQRIDIAPGKVQEYSDFSLEDLVYTMLQNAIDNEPQRVGHYTDMGRYLFANNRIKESASFYVRGLKVASEPLTFAKDASNEERELDQRLRNQDAQNINDDIRKMQGGHGPGVPMKDLREFDELVTKQQDENGDKNPADWNTVQIKAENFVRDNKYDQAETALRGHIQAAKQMPTAAQAYIQLVSVMLRRQHGAEALQVGNEFAATRFPSAPALARQMANAIYSASAALPAADKMPLLKLAEKLLLQALTSAATPKHGEMAALCKFELGHVLVMQERLEEAIPLYRDSVTDTGEATTKALRSKSEVDALIRLKRFAEARQIVNLLAANTHTDIADWARTKAKELDALTPK